MNFQAANKDGQEPVFQLTAMVDVVFMLLAFFVLASQFRLPERDVATDHRESQPAAAAAGAGDLPSHIPVLLRRRPSGVGITIGQASLRDNDFDGICAKLSEINMPSIGVVILAERTLSVGQVARAMDAVLQSPMRKISVCELRASAGTGADLSRGG